MQTPVLLIIFRRADLTRRALAAIHAAQPSALLIAADGPRGAYEEEACATTRRTIEEFDWQCPVHTNFADANLGCGVRVHSGITWALSLYEETIILEDDCLPNESFFRFCETLLAYYRDDERVMHVSGDNFVGPESNNGYSYYFSKYTHASGWATWRRAWRHFDWSLQRWPEAEAAGILEAVHNDPYERRYWREILERLRLGAPDIWDYQWNFACWSQSGLVALPTVNLVMNDGWGPDATHTKDALAWPETAQLGEIRHPPYVFRNEVADSIQFNRNFGGAAMKQYDSPRAKIRRGLEPAIAPLRPVKKALIRTLKRLKP